MLISVTANTNHKQLLFTFFMRIDEKKLNMFENGNTLIRFKGTIHHGAGAPCNVQRAMADPGRTLCRMMNSFLFIVYNSYDVSLVISVSVIFLFGSYGYKAVQKIFLHKFRNYHST